MNTISRRSSDGWLATALARAQSWLIEPIEQQRERTEIRARPVVAVVGLTLGSGATTIARALAVELARRDPNGAAAVMSASPRARVSLAGASTIRLARALGAPGGAEVSTSGSLCILAGGDPVAVTTAVRHLAPLVMDVGHGGAAGAAASLADHVAVVASSNTQAALSNVVTASLARVGPEPVLLVNRLAGAWPKASETAYEFPESRVGARLAFAGRGARDGLSRAAAALADAVEMPRAEW